MSGTGETPGTVAERPRPPEPEGPSRSHSVLREIASGNALAGVLAVVLAVAVGSLMIAVTDERVRETASYVFARPSDFLGATWDAIWGAYTALLRGSVYNDRVDDFATRIRPLTETLKFAAPLIAAGLGVGLAFRAGLFNIGGRGQMLLAGAAAGWVAANLGLPTALHLPLAVLAGMLAGALWAGIAGVLKARTGAHEVIVTIMLNFIVLALLNYAVAAHLRVPETLHTPEIRAGGVARLGDALGAFRGSAANFTLLAAAAAALAVGWFLFRSRAGYELRATGLQPDAAESAGIRVPRVSGALAGLGGVNFVLGYKRYYEDGFAGGAGFLGIAVALVGRNHPLGVILAALFFATLSQGGLAINSLVPKQMVEVMQGIVILAVAVSVPEVRRLLSGRRAT